MSCNDLPCFSAGYLQLWPMESQISILIQRHSYRCVHTSQIPGSWPVSWRLKDPHSMPPSSSATISFTSSIASAFRPCLHPSSRLLAVWPPPCFTVCMRICDKRHYRSLNCWIFRRLVRALCIGCRISEQCLFLPLKERTFLVIYFARRRRPVENWRGRGSHFESSYFSSDHCQMRLLSNALWTLYSDRWDFSILKRPFNNSDAPLLARSAYASTICMWTLCGLDFSPAHRICRSLPRRRQTRDASGSLWRTSACLHSFRACPALDLSPSRKPCPDTRSPASRARWSNHRSGSPWMAHYRRGVRKDRLRLTRYRLGNLCSRFLTRFLERCRQEFHTVQIKALRLVRPVDWPQSRLFWHYLVHLGEYCPIWYLCALFQCYACTLSLALSTWRDTLRLARSVSGACEHSWEGHRLDKVPWQSGNGCRSRKSREAWCD